VAVDSFHSLFTVTVSWFVRQQSKKVYELLILYSCQRQIATILKI
jgi:hypothetical protein